VTEPTVSGVNAALMLVWMFLSIGGLVAIAAFEVYRAWRARRNERQVGAEQLMKRGFKKLPVIRVNAKPRFDERSTIDRFRRESGR
jgi:hypothetical protein